MLLLAVGEADPSQPPPTMMTREAWFKAHADDELEALDELAGGPHATGAWKRLHDLYRECPGCCENSADEGFGWIPATLLAKHWVLVDEFGALAVKDPAWLDFVMKRLHGPIDPKLLRQAAANARTCPKAHRRLCERIRVNAQQAAKEVEGEMRRDP